MSWAGLEVPDASAVCRKWWRDGGACAAATAAYFLPLLLGYRTGRVVVNQSAAIMPKVRIFEGSAQEVRNVRDFVGQLISRCPIAHDVVLLASELATNAILHTASGAGGKFYVFVYADDACVRVEVHDLGSVTQPAVRDCDSPGESGTGLRLVDEIADRWGFHGGQYGRVVWFEMDWR